MRRYFFYFFAAFLSFVFSTFITIQIYRQVTDEFKFSNTVNYVGEKQKTEVLAEGVFSISDNEVMSVSKKFTCEDKALQPFWNKLRKHKNFNNPKKFYKQVDWNGSNGKYDCSYFFRINERADLNGDGENEIFVQGINTGFCEMTADCENYVFEKKTGVYKQILFELASIEYEIKASQTNGYFDIEFRDNDRLGDNKIWIYKFNGKNYQAVNCYRNTLRTFKDGEIVTFNPPKVIREKCREPISR